MSKPKVAYAGDGYLLAGMKDGLATVAVSLDGLEWTESPPSRAVCEVLDVIGGPSLALVVDRCDGLWLVDVLPG